MIKNLATKWIYGAALIGNCTMAFIAGALAGALLLGYPVGCLIGALVIVVPLLIGEAL